MQLNQHLAAQDQLYAVCVGRAAMQMVAYCDALAIIVVVVLLAIARNGSSAVILATMAVSVTVVHRRKHAGSVRRVTAPTC